MMSLRDSVMMSEIDEIGIKEDEENEEFSESIGVLKILFVCSKNKVRSLTAEKVLRRYPGYQTRSAGTDKTARVKVNAGDIGWADIIFVMDRYNLIDLKTLFGELLEGKEIHLLGISNEQNRYKPMEPKLIHKITDALSLYLDL